LSITRPFLVATNQGKDDNPTHALVLTG